MVSKKAKFRYFTVFILVFSLVFSSGVVHAEGYSPQSVLEGKSLPEVYSNVLRQNGELAVYVGLNNGWVEAGSLSFNEYLHVGKIDLAGQLPPSGETVGIRLVQRGGGAAHLDLVSLGGTIPLAVDNESGLALRKLSRNDYDLMAISENEVELLFPFNGEGQMLSITARIEGERISEIPFQFPKENNYQVINEDSSYFSYRMDSAKGSLVIDGQIDEVSFQEPFFKEQVYPGTGHPPGFIYGWVMNDDQNLYVTMDVTPDNTMDGDKDYAKVYVKTAKGIKEFKVSLPETAWGEPSFIYTDKVVYQHKVYEFTIPLKELGVDGDSMQELLLAFAAYGTMALPDLAGPALGFSPENNNYLSVYQGNSGLFGQLVETDGSYGDELLIANAERGFEYGYVPSVSLGFEDEEGDELYLVVGFNNNNDQLFGQRVSARDGSFIGAPLTITDSDAFVNIFASPSIAFDPVQKRFLVVWSDSRDENNENIYGQFVSVNGAPDGGNFVISNKLDDQTFPAVTYGNGRFLVVWEDHFDIYGQLLDANNGALLGTASDVNFAISDFDSAKHSPSVAYDSHDARFLVAWDDTRNGGTGQDIYAQLINSDGTLFGAESNVNFAVSNAPFFQKNPTLAYDPERSRFLVAWQDYRNLAYDIYGQYVTRDGTCTETAAGTNFVISSAAGNQTEPSVAYNSRDENFLVAFRTLPEAINYETVGSQNPQEVPAWQDGTLTASNVTRTSLTLTWSGARDNVGVTGYRIYRDGSLFKTVGDVLTIDITGLTAGTAYTFTVKAGDAEGNWSDWGPWTSVTMLVDGGIEPLPDGELPTWNEQSTLTASNVTTQSSLTLTWSAASDNVGVTGYRIYKNGSLFDTVGDVLTTVVTGLISGTAYTFKVEAGDAAGNWTINGPSGSVNTPRPVSSGGGYKAPEKATITGTVTGNSDATGHLVPLSGIRVTVSPVSGSGNTGSTLTRDDGSYTMANLLPGDYKIEFTDSNQDIYLQEWFNNQRTRQEAKIITLSPKEVYTANATLDLRQRKVPERIGGTDRYDTAKQIASTYFSAGADTVFLARGDISADALIAVPLARKLNAPLLLTPPDQLLDEVLNEIKVLGAKNVIIMGGTGAISQSVTDTLMTQIPNITVQRIAGIDRHETAYLTAKRLGSQGEAVIVSGNDNAFPDALSISSWAAYHEVPILYADEGGASQLPQATVNALQELNVTKTLLVGGTSVLPQALESLLPNPVRYGGVDRFTTNARVLGELQPNPTSIFVATGNDFADALAGAAVAGQINAWLVLTEINSEQARLLESVKGGVLDFHAFGGPGAVSDKALSDIKELLGR